MKKLMFLIGISSLVFIGCESTKSGFKNMGRDIGEASRNVGDEIKDGTKSTIKTIDKSVGDGLDSAGESIKDASE
ncbi:MAG: hypothetical protein ACLFQJ_07850 [Campylobacterales bacterium]